MSRALEFCCPACRMEFRSVSAAREHATNVSRDRDEHDIVMTLTDKAFENPDFGEKGGGWNWPLAGPHHTALKPLRDFRASKEAAK